MSVLGQLETSRPNSWRGIRSFPTSLINGQNNYNGVVVLCQEGAKAPCCTRDEGGPFGAVL